MSGLSVEARVYTAADEIEHEGGKPTVSSVRERAGVNNADATKFLRNWREDRNKAGSKIAALPAALNEHAQRLAAAMWVEASTVADERHAALEREWREQSTLQEQEIGELVSNLDEAEKSAQNQAEAHKEALKALEEKVAQAQAAQADAEKALKAAEDEKTNLATLLAQERASNSTLQATINALIARIPESKGE